MMKTIQKLMLLVLVGVFLMPFQNVLATVGGPTLIHEFRYNSANESVYYIEQDSGGRGCPPELFRLSLNTGNTSVVYSCDQGENEPNQANDKINAIIKDFKPLSSLSLKDNKITIDVKYIRSENISPEINEIIRRHFTTTVYQNGVKVSEFPITGCNVNQPFAFQGFSIPGFDKKIVLLLSTKGDCFEGGYTKETLHMVPGVSNLNKSANTFYKGPTPLTPNEGNLVVYEADKVTPKPSPNTATTTPNTPAEPVVSEPDDSENKSDNSRMGIILISSLVALTVLGIIMYRVSTNRRRVL